MVLTRDHKEIIRDRIKRDPEFAIGMLDEAASVFLAGEPVTARLALRELVNSTIGFEQLAMQTATPSKSLHRMLSAKGNPKMDNLATIFKTLQDHLRVTLHAQTVEKPAAIATRPRKHA